jgi:hypothetical protein
MRLASRYQPNILRSGAVWILERTDWKARDLRSSARNILPTNPDNDRVVILDIWSLIEDAKANPPVPIILGLLNEGEIAGLHGPQEAFKTIFAFNLPSLLPAVRPRWDAVWVRCTAANTRPAMSDLR